MVALGTEQELLTVIVAKHIHEWEDVVKSGTQTYTFTCYGAAAAWISRSVPHTLSCSIPLICSSIGSGWQNAFQCSLLCLLKAINSRLMCWWLFSLLQMMVYKARNKQLLSPCIVLTLLWILCKKLAASIHTWWDATWSTVYIWNYRVYVIK